MGIPLNIDWQQILLHLFNFVILACGLYLLLYKPVKSFMDKRTAHYQELTKSAEEKLANAENLEAQRQSQLADMNAEISRKQAEAAKTTQAKTDAALQRAQEQAEQILADARKSANAEKDRIVASAGREIAELAAEAADKLMKEASQHE